MMKTIFLTGGTGFLGGKVIEALLKEGISELAGKIANY